MLFFLAFIAVHVAFATGSAAQSPRALRLELENDAYNFWRQPGRRPDRDYTNGVHLIYEGAAAPWWSRPLMRSGHRNFEAGQDIFTPAAASDSVAMRPYAGWLYVRDVARTHTPRTTHEISLTLGVTGPPALAEQMQKLAHHFATHYDDVAIDWSDQLPFEPGVVLGYAHERRWATSAARVFGTEVLPRVAVRLGNVATDAEAGIALRAGFNLGEPWSRRTRGAASLSTTLRTSMRAVARNLFLDGPMFRRTAAVGHEPLVAEHRWSVDLRVRWLALGYGATTTGRAYPGGPVSHTWSSMTATILFARGQ